MASLFFHASHGDAELQIDAAQTPDHLDVSITTGGAATHATVDASNAESGGWSQSTVLVTQPEASLLDLCDYIAAHVDGWEQAQTWTSRCGQLGLTFSHRPDGVCMDVSLRAATATAETSIDIASRDIGSLLTRLRSLVVALPV